MINNANYEVLIDKDVPDVNSRGYLLKHKKTGARISILSNDDDNKVFYIGFRTPPEDSTGVAHIMEHSVLCGSERYPLKDPFIELAKGSMNTFLNAMTYPDKTVYPVASCNDKDFANLMSVYMDAVFHPNIYKHSEIFRQEGWNYNLESPDDDITYNGVVFNEMKGAYSSCEGFLEREIMSSLFPDTAYGFESGGEPNFIPDLTYEQFLNFHRKFYHPSNSFIFLYGNMDIEERLDWMDREYLSKYDYADIDSHIDRQEPFGELKTLELEYPISDDEEEKDNAYMSYNIVCGDISNPEECLAMQMLVYALADTQGAPIRQRLLDEDVCKDVIPGYDSGIMQPYLFIEAKNSNLYDKDRFIEIIRDELRKAANGALNRKSLLASLNQIKFRFREADYGSEPKGLIYGLTMLDSWIFNEDKPFLSIEINDILDDLGNKIDSGYFEQLIAEKLLGSTHTSFVVLKPRKELTA
ncbi:MAG: insulinase family protein, partial [Lachnospiraceae bacterium]|nr:insulinase family protein [Lachnospiraceae bacterium]